MLINSSAPTGAYAKLKTYLGRVIRDIERRMLRTLIALSLPAQPKSV
jgi:hypothetical protein